MNEIIEAGYLSRYDMNYRTYRQLQRDHIRFEEKYAEKFSNNYIIRILINYMCYAQNNFLVQFEFDAAKRLENEYHDEYIKNDRISFTKPLTEKFTEFEFIHNKSFKKRTIITFILEQFALLPLSEREKIYCYPQYCTVTELTEKNKIILITLLSGKNYEVKPYSIKTDENTLSYYLIGYSKLKDSKENFESCAFKLSRIKNCKSCHKDSMLSLKEIKLLKEVRDKFGSAYIVKNLLKEEIKNTVVRLTKNGYERLYLKIIAYQRPIPIEMPKQIIINGSVFYELKFDCSYKQIRNYFFSFGAEAEILYPSELRKIFISDLQAAKNRYNLNE